MIDVARTGRVFSFTGVEFLVTFPDGSKETLWSPPWQIDDAGAGVGYDDPRQDEGARREAQRIWRDRQSVEVLRARDAIQSDSNAALERHRQEVAELRRECHERRFDPNLVEQLQYERDHSKMLSEANSALHVEKRAVENYCAKVRSELTAITADRDRLREGLMEACDIAEAALHPGKGAIARPRIAELRLLTTREAKP